MCQYTDANLAITRRSENTVVVLKDGTVMCIFRKDGGDGVPHHFHVPYVIATSNDEGYTWTLRNAPTSLLSARPRAVVLSSGAIVLAGGRPALNIWVSRDGAGEKWATLDVPTEHNKLVRDPTLRFCDAFENATLALGWAGIKRIHAGYALIAGKCTCML